MKRVRETACTVKVAGVIRDDNDKHQQINAKNEASFTLAKTSQLVKEVRSRVVAKIESMPPVETSFLSTVAQARYV